jgi:hypothetical protein
MINIDKQRVTATSSRDPAVPSDDNRIQRNAPGADAPGRRAGGLHGRFKRGGRA